MVYNGKSYPSYEISSCGRLRQTKTKAICKTYKTRYGYIEYHKPAEDGETKRVHLRIHRAVAYAFIPNPNGLSEVNHIDGHKQNNNFKNLEWVSHKDNMHHAVKKGLRKGGFGNPRKLSERDVIYVRKNPNNLSNYRLAKMFGMDKKTMRDIRCGKTYKDI